MKLIPIENSSNIEAIGYDVQSRQMHVRFKGGTIYAHDDVTPLKHAEFIASKSKGAHYHENFKGKHNVRKLV